MGEYHSFVFTQGDLSLPHDGGVLIIGELAPLLSVLGHQMHKHHKTAATLIWMHVAVLFHYYTLKAGIW
jgi:hypothetical protein